MNSRPRASDYPETVTTDAKKKPVHVTTSSREAAPNPVLREGNSDRRAPLSVKNYARKHLAQDSGRLGCRLQSHIAHMNNGDFYGSEKPCRSKPLTLSKLRWSRDGTTTVLKERPTCCAGEIIDTAVLSKKPCAASSPLKLQRRQEASAAVGPLDTHGLRPDHVRQIVAEFYVHRPG